MSKKKYRFHSVDVDPEAFAIVVSYTTETPTFDAAGILIGQEAVPGRKAVKVPRGMRPDEIPGVAQEIVERIKYIPHSKINEVEHQLAMLQQYEAQVSGGQDRAQQQQQAYYQQPPPPPPPGGRHQQGGAFCDQPPSQQPPSQDPWQQPPADRAAKPARRQEPILPDADIRHLDAYQEQLYEEVMENKVSGAKRILRVCTDPQHLEIIADQESLLGVLSRELKENSKKSVELSVSIVCTFLCFSHFSQFHPVLMQHQCGNVIMKVFEYESERHQVRKAEMERRTMRFQELGDKATPEDKKLLVKDEKKYKAQLSRQNKLIFVCLISLLNLAEEISTEKKMVNRKMPALLAQVLERDYPELLLVTLQFVKKLSMFEENKDAMNTPETLSRLVQLASHEDIRIALLTLRVLYNFSFDESIRISLIDSGIVKLLVDLLRNPPFRGIVLKLLYQFSMDDRCKSLMAYHRDGMIMLLQLVVHFPEPRVGKDLVALVVNLATHALAAEVIVGSGLFPQVVVRVIKTRDPLLCKVVRHVSSHDSVLPRMHELLQSENARMAKWMHELVYMAPSCVDNPDLLVEILGTLANMTLEDVPWGELCEAGLIDLLTRVLMPGFSEDDIVLECVMIVGNLALSVESAQYVGNSRVPTLLQQNLVEKRDDEEIATQILYTFQCLLVFDDVREVVLSETELAASAMRFARSQSPAVLEQATRLLQLVADHGGDAEKDWAEQVKAFRFEQHNAAWCRFIARDLNGQASHSPGGCGGYYDDEQSGGEDEEEFRFRCANGYAMDAADLRDRDWGNQDIQQLMHTARQMSLS